tara:strand:+ start:97 stop:399 length:303 start_codon:yes stop_codon:yes gene_type:complete
MKNTFRIIAFLEGVSYILLMTVGLYFKYQLNDPTYVKLLGMPHGILFVSYLILAFLIIIIHTEKEQWKNKDFGIIILASILPFGTFYVDWKYLKNLSSKI